MQATATAASSSKMIWAGRILSGVIVAFLLFDGIIHLTRIAPVVQAFAQLGFPLGLAVPLGLVELLCVAVYVYPRTAMLGAILLTGYLGGAVVTHLRVGNPLFGETLFPVYVGILLWGGLYLREPRLRALIPVSPAPAAPSKKMLWAGRGVSALVALMMLFAAAVKLLSVEGVAQGFERVGFGAPLVPVVGCIELVCTVLYVIPPTRILGAILMAGLLGGAVATNVRVSDPTWIMPAVLGVLAWLGVFLRDEHVRALIPVRR